MNKGNITPALRQHTRGSILHVPSRDNTSFEPEDDKGYRITRQTLLSLPGKFRTAAKALERAGDLVIIDGTGSI